MLFVGVDIAKYKHDVSIIDQSGNIYLRHLTIENTVEGFNQLQQVLSNAELATNDGIQIGLEDTGHYCYNLIAFLRKNDYAVFSYNPLLIKEFSKATSLRKTKTDKKDALTIARKLMSDCDKAHFEINPIMIELKYATRNVTRIKKQVTNLKIQYTRILDIIFPELVSIVGNTGKHNQYVYELLKQFPSPQKIASAHLTKLTNILKSFSHGHCSKIRALEIRNHAKKTIGQKSAVLEFELLQTINAIQYFNELRSEADNEVMKLMREIDSPLMSIPGIGFNLASIILAEIRNIDNFKKPAQLLAFAGSEPSISTSGENQISNGHMVKRGSPYLRWALHEAAKGCARWSPSIKIYLQKKIGEGKHYNVAVSHVVKKLVRIIFHMLKYNVMWNENEIIIN